MAEKQEQAPTTQRANTIWKLLEFVANVAVTVVVIVLTGGKSTGGRG